ncbi:MAG: hypothetical protein M3416_03790 [Acidobacteriota bacterium]|nr:hypothetical protein [Acidobacteriota bacterium]
MRRNNLTLALASVLCLITATIGFGGDYLKSIFRGNAPAAALTGTATAATEAPPTTPASEPQRDPQAVTVYITRTGERYHRGSCRHLHSSKIPVSLREAKSRGYTPCKVCRPAR